MSFNFKTLTPDATVPDGFLLIGADSQSAASPSIYSGSKILEKLLGATAFSGETVTTSKPLIDMVQTWNDAAVPFTGLRWNFTDTASAAASLLMDLQVGETSKFSVDKAGTISFGANGTIESNSTGRLLFKTGSDTSGFAGSRFTAVSFGIGSNALNPDLRIERDAANIFAQRNGLFAQTGRWYGSYTDVSNNAGFEIVTQAGDTLLRSFANGTGTKRSIVLDGANRATYSETAADIAAALVAHGIMAPA